MQQYSFYLNISRLVDDSTKKLEWKSTKEVTAEANWYTKHFKFTALLVTLAWREWIFTVGSFVPALWRQGKEWEKQNQELLEEHSRSTRTKGPQHRQESYTGSSSHHTQHSMQSCKLAAKADSTDEMRAERLTFVFNLWILDTTLNTPYTFLGNAPHVN